MFLETVEIIVQIMALMVYSGVEMPLTNIPLAIDPDRMFDFSLILGVVVDCIFQLFSKSHMYVLIGFNCMLFGTMWLIYILKPKSFHGYRFWLVLFCIDSLIEFFYTTFPLVVLLNDKSSYIRAQDFIKSVAVLHPDNMFVFFFLS